MTKKEILHNIAVIDDIVMGHLENYTSRSESELMWYKEKLMKDLEEIKKQEEEEWT